MTEVDYQHVIAYAFGIGLLIGVTYSAIRIALRWLWHR